MVFAVLMVFLMGAATGVEFTAANPDVGVKITKIQSNLSE